MLTDIAMVPPILKAGTKSTGYKSKRSDRTLTGATLEMEILSQCGESTMKDFKLNHGKGNVAGQLVPVEYNRLTVSEAVSIDEPAGGYLEMLEYLMTNLMDLIIQEGAAVACAKWRDALCFIRFMIEQISVSALNTCVKLLREGDERAKALLLLALLDMQQSKPMRVNMKEPEELEPMRKIDEIRRFSNKELRFTEESMGALPKSSEYCGPIKKKSYSYVSGIIGIAYNHFLSEDIRDCFFDYRQAVLLRFWTSGVVTIKSATNPQIKLGLVLEKR